MSVFMLVTQRLDYYRFLLGFEIEKCESTNFVLLFQEGFSYLIPFIFILILDQLPSLSPSPPKNQKAEILRDYVDSVDQFEN